MKKIHWIVLGAALAVTLVLEFTVLAGYGGHWWNAIPAFYMLWGGLSALVLIVVSKWLGAGLLQVDEHFYHRQNPDDK